MNEIGTATVKITGNLFNTDTWPEYNFYQPTPIYNVSCRNYKCPCGGEFNQLGETKDSITSTVVYCCPFCQKRLFIRGE